MDRSDRKSSTSIKDSNNLQVSSSISGMAAASAAMMMGTLPVCPAAYTAMSAGDVSALAQLPPLQVRPLLPTLARIAFTEGLDTSDRWTIKRKQLISVVSGYEELTSILSLLAINFQELEADMRREQQHRAKVGYNPADGSTLLANLKDGLASEFEHAEGIRRLRLLLAELLAISSVLPNPHGRTKTNSFRKSELFDSHVFLDDICDSLAIACAELPNTVVINEVVEVLLGTKNGPVIVCRLVANFPHSFQTVCSSLIQKGSTQDEDSLESRVRLETVRMLCLMNPNQTRPIRSQAVQLCRMPALTVALTVDLMTQHQRTHASSKGTNSRSSSLLPEIVVDDLVSFFIGLILGGDERYRQWFANFVKLGQKKMDSSSHTCLSHFRLVLLEATQKLTDSLSERQPSQTSIIQASTLLRFWCALRGVALIKLTEDEIGAISSLIMCRLPPSSVGAHFISLGLCTLLATPSLMTGPGGGGASGGGSSGSSGNSSENERRFVDWLQWLVKEEGFFVFASGTRESFGELLLLIAIHFHTNSTSSIGDLVCSTLGMKLTLRPPGLNRMKTIFAQEVFTDQVIASYAVKVPVTLKLNASMQGFLPVNCIFNLLKSRSFSKHKVHIKKWIMAQICSSCAPIHPVIPPLIRAFVDSIIVPSSKSTPQLTNEPIEPSDISKVFKVRVYCEGESSVIPSGCDPDNQEFVPMDVDGEQSKELQPVCTLTSQLLLLYYLLYYEQVRLANMRNIILTNRKVLKYSSDLLNQIPIFYLLQEARSDEVKYGSLFPNFLHLIANHYPHLCLVEDWLAAERRYALSGSNQIKRASKKFLESCIDQLEKGFERIEESKDESHVDFSRIERVMEHILTLPMRQLWPVSNVFVKYLSVFLLPSCPESLLNKMKKCWWRLNSIFPRYLWVKTVNNLRTSDERTSTFPVSMRRVDLKWFEMVEDPLHTLRCDKRVLLCPQMMEITLHVLQGCLVASRIYLSQHLMERPPVGPNLPKGGIEEIEGEIREELRCALCAAQESAAIQILLECCLENEQSKGSLSKALLGRAKQVQALICSHLHQVYINDPNLAKLVHFQGYHSDLLPVTVKQIPSMHICIDFIPEMFSQPCWRKQQFAVELTSHLALQYPVVKSLNVARLSLNTCHTLLGILPASKQSEFFHPVVPSIGRIVEAFPSLRDEALALLLQLSQITISRLAFTSPYFTYSNAILQKYPIEPDDNFTTSDFRRYFAAVPKCDPLLVSIVSIFNRVIDMKPPRQWAIKGSK